jgi:hypothetical protein
MYLFEYIAKNKITKLKNIQYFSNLKKLFLSY